MAHKRVLFRSAAREEDLGARMLRQLASVLLLTEATLTEVPDASDKKEPGASSGEFG